MFLTTHLHASEGATWKVIILYQYSLIEALCTCRQSTLFNKDVHGEWLAVFTEEETVWYYIVVDGGGAYRYSLMVLQQCAGGKVIVLLWCYDDNRNYNDIDHPPASS